jgi:hypothetical protein
MHVLFGCACPGSELKETDMVVLRPTNAGAMLQHRNAKKTAVNTVFCSACFHHLVFFKKTRFYMNHAISLEQAIEMTARYREQKEKILNPEFLERNILPLAESFDRAAFEKLLSQPGCTGLRLYYGLNEEGQLRAIFVGINEKEEDILPGSGTGDEIIVEDGMVCPPICAPSSPLNG